MLIFASLFPSPSDPIKIPLPSSKQPLHLELIEVAVVGGAPPPAIRGTLVVGNFTLMIQLDPDDFEADGDNLHRASLDSLHFVALTEELLPCECQLFGFPVNAQVRLHFRADDRLTVFAHAVN